MTIPHTKNVTRMTTVWCHSTCILRGGQVGTTDRQAKKVCPSVQCWYTWQKTECGTPYQQELYSIQCFHGFLHFSNSDSVLTHRSKLWQTIETEKCFWLLQRHLLKILRSFWMSGYGRSFSKEGQISNRTWMTADVTAHAIIKSLTEK
jgi:hypothetical protein